jgi:hypothetical protein
VHDAVLVEGDASDAIELAQALDQLMRDASALVLKGYELPSDRQTILPGEHFVDDRGAVMWETITKLLAIRERGAA